MPTRRNYKRTGVYGQRCVPTLHYFRNPNYQADVEAIYEAIRDDDKDKLIEILCHRTMSQRNRIGRQYERTFGEELNKTVKKSFSGDFKKLMSALTKDSLLLDVIQIRSAVMSSKKNEQSLIDIICQSEKEDLEKMQQIYNSKFNSDMDNDILKDLTPELRKCFEYRLKGHHSFVSNDQRLNVRNYYQAYGNNESARQCAQDLYNAGEGKWGTDESVFINILSEKNKFQLFEIFEEYKKLTGHDIFQAIKREFSGDLEYALTNLALLTLSPPRYYAQCVHEAVAGFGTADKALIRIIVNRSEIDLECIKKEYKKDQNEDMVKRVKSETSGHYQKALLVLCGDY